MTVPSEESNNLKTYFEEETLQLSEVIITGNSLGIDLKQISQPGITHSNLDLEIKRNLTIHYIFLF